MKRQLELEGLPRKRTRRDGTLEQKLWATPMEERPAPYDWLAEPCLLLKSNLRPDGYGWISDHGTVRLAHRVAYELSGDPVAPGALVLHHCDRRSCIQRSHLYTGTHADNNQDCLSRGRWRGPGGVPAGVTRVCAAEGCTNPAGGSRGAKRLCSTHYQRSWREANADRVRANAAAYYRANRAQVIARTSENRRRRRAAA